MSVADAAEFLGVSIPFVYACVNKRKIPFVKIGERLKFTEAALNQWIEENAVGVGEKQTEFRKKKSKVKK
jgi:excisionase family DNA binding protein